MTTIASARRALLGLLGAIAALATLSPARVLAADPLKSYDDSIIPLRSVPGLVASVAPTSEVKRSQILELHFWLKTNSTEPLKTLIQNGQIVSLSDLKEKYGGNAQSSRAVTAWLTAHGFTVTATAPDFSGLYASATIDTIETQLHVHMINVVQDGKTYISATGPPYLPSEVSDFVVGIDGLQTFSQANTHSVWPSELGVQATQTGVIPNTVTTPGYTPRQILKTYGIGTLPLTGKGQTIAVLINTVPAQPDVTAFWKAAAVSSQWSHIELINVSGKQWAPTTGEETLDVEWTSGVAPAATIRVYAAGSLALVSIDKALDQVMADIQTTPAMRQMSISLGRGETYLSKREIIQQSVRFTKLAALGMNTFVSSGDAGSNPDVWGKSATGALQVEYQASDPYVIAVGGTSLQWDAATSKVLERAWVGSGGGLSRYFRRPPWQSGLAIGGMMRLVPDVAAVGDPLPGAFIIYQSLPRTIGGTSWSAPIWAGICALLNESRVTAGKSPLPFLSPLLYRQIGSGTFRDIVDGSNGNYAAGKPYNPVTGLGVPDIQQLVNTLTH